MKACLRACLVLTWPYALAPDTEKLDICVVACQCCLLPWIVAMCFASGKVCFIFVSSDFCAKLLNLPYTAVMLQLCTVHVEGADDHRSMTCHLVPLTFATAEIVPACDQFPCACVCMHIPCELYSVACCFDDVELTVLTHVLIEQLASCCAPSCWFCAFAIRKGRQSTSGPFNAMM